MSRFLKSSTVLALIVMLAAPTAAMAFRAQNTLKVNPEGNGQFEVIQRGGMSGAADIWCAAGDYALRRLGAAANQRVYLVEGKHIARTEERRRFGYSFSLTPPAQALQQTPLTLSLNAVGDNLRAISAQQYCYDRLGDPNIIRP